MKTMQKHLISVIIPVYNSADTIRRCVESVIAQTYKDLEIIIVYKPSTDNSLKILRSIHDKRIHIVEQTEPTGPGGARNIGIDIARGEWLGFCEADDTIHPDFYEKLLNTAISTNSDIAMGQIYVKGKPFSSLIKPGVYSTIREKYGLLGNGASFDKLFRADMIKKHNIRFIEYVRWEDNPFLFSALYYGKLATVPGATYYYNPSEWTEKYCNKLKADITPVATSIMNFISDKNLSGSEIRFIQKRMVDCFAASFISDSSVYNNLMRIFGNPMFLRMRYYKQKLRSFRKKIFNKNKQKEKQ